MQRDDGLIYVDIELLRKAREIQRERPVFCDYCGVVNPPDGFYPLGIGGPDSISCVICNKCAQER